MKGEYLRTVDPRADYAAASPSKFRRTRQGLYGSGDSHYANEQRFLQMREYSLDMYRNDAVIGQAIRQAVVNEVQTGFMYQPDTGDTGLDEELRLWMEDWASDPEQCDVTGRMSLPEIEFMIGVAEKAAGDMIILPLDNDRLQLVETNRLRTPTNTKQNVVHGILLDKLRRPEQYWFAPDNINPWQRWERVNEAVKIDAYDGDGNKQVYHLYDPARVTQTRGVPALHAAYDFAGMYEDSTFATLVRHQMAACLVGSWEKTSDYSAPMQTGEQTETRLVDGSTMIDQGISPGQMFNPPKGMKLAIHSPQIPSAEAMEFSRRILQIIFLSLGLPLAYGLMDGKETNFSGQRFSGDLAKMGFRRTQRRRKTQFYYELARWRIRRKLTEDAAMRKTAAKSNIKIFRHDWQSPGWPYPQPVHDVTADAMKLTNLITSPRRLHAEDGRNYQRVMRESIEDNGAAILAAAKKADEINSELGKKIVTWRDVLNRDMPKGDQLIDTAENPNTNDGAAPAPAGGATNSNGNGQGGHAMPRMLRRINRDSKGLIRSIVEEPYTSSNGDGHEDD